MSFNDGFPDVFSCFVMVFPWFAMFYESDQCCFSPDSMVTSIPPDARRSRNGTICLDRSRRRNKLLGII